MPVSLATFSKYEQTITRITCLHLTVLYCGSDGKKIHLQCHRSRFDSLEKGMATHSSILAWEIPWTEEPGGLQSMGSQRVGATTTQDRATKCQHARARTHTHTHTHTHTRRVSHTTSALRINLLSFRSPQRSLTLVQSFVCTHIHNFYILDNFKLS